MGENGNACQNGGIARGRDPDCYCDCSYIIFDGANCEIAPPTLAPSSPPTESASNSFYNKIDNLKLLLHEA